MSRIAYLLRKTKWTLSSSPLVIYFLKNGFFVFVQIASLCVSDQEGVPVTLTFHITTLARAGASRAGRRGHRAGRLSSARHCQGEASPTPTAEQRQEKWLPTPYPHRRSRHTVTRILPLTLQHGLPGCAPSLFRTAVSHLLPRVSSPGS